MNTINEFLVTHIDKVGSARELARRADLSHQTINDLSAYTPDDPLPSMQTVIKLAKATNTDPMTIFALLLKDRVDVPRAETDDWILAQQVKELPNEYRQLIADLAQAAVAKQRNNHT